MKKLLIGTLSLLLSSAASLADTTTLKQALIEAYLNSPSLAEARTGILNLDEVILQERSAFLPSVNGTLSYTASETNGTPTAGQSGTTTAAVSISQLLFDGGQTRGKIDAAKLNALAGRMNLANAEQQILLSAISAFIDVRAAQSTLNLRDNNVRVLRRQVQAAKDRFEVGEVTRTDVSLAEASLAGAISAREAARANVLTQSAIYESIIGTAPHRLGAMGRPPALPSTVDDAEQIAMVENPEVAAARFGYQSAKMSLLVARRNTMPTVSASISTSNSDTVTGAYTGDGAQSDGTSASITATIPLYQGGRLKSSQRIAANDLDIARLQLTQTENSVRSELRSAYFTWQAALAEQRARQEQIRATQVAYEGTQEEAKLGARTTLDVLDAEQDLLEARTNLVTTQRNEQVAAYSVLAAMGRLTPELLALDVEAITPAKVENPIDPSNKMGEKRLKLLEKIESRYNKN